MRGLPGRTTSELVQGSSLFGEIQRIKGSYIVNESITLSEWIPQGQGGGQVQTTHDRGHSGCNIRIGVFLLKNLHYVHFIL